MTMNKIIYATDFSEESKKALHYAYELSKRSGAELLLLHIFDIPTIWNSEMEGPDFPKMEEDAMEYNIQKLKDFYEAVLDTQVDLNKIGFEALESASPVMGILEAAKKHKADLLVMGTKGKSKAREILIGSTTMSIIRQSPCPVFSVPEEGNYKELNKIMYATDFDPNDIDALKELKEIADLYDTKILVEHITETTEEDPEQNLQILKSKAEESKIDHRYKFGLTIAQDIYTGLNSFVRENDIDLLVMYEREHSGARRWFHRDIVKRMENHTPVPILTYNEKAIINFVELDEIDSTQIG